MIQEKKYDVFISYRREGGKNIARLLKTELGLRGYHAFLDFDELKDGRFDKRIMDAIDAAPVFMFILSDHALDRCVDENDWVRKEIEYAMATERHIIPINPDKSFSDFPEYVPKNLKDGLGLHHFSQLLLDDLFNQTMDKLVAERLEPVLGKRNRYQMSTTGATIHLNTDANCEVYRYGKHECNVVTGEDKIVYLKKGKHKFEFVSIDNEKAKYSMVFTVEDIDMEDLIEIALLPTIQECEREEREAAERLRKEQERVRKEQEEQERIRKEQIEATPTEKEAKPKKTTAPKKTSTPKNPPKKADSNPKEEEKKQTKLMEEFLASAKLSFNSKDMTAEITKYRTDASAVVILETVMHNHKSYRITSIGKNAFYAFFGCNDYLKSLQLPDSITTIGKGAFQFLHQLTSITIPDGVTTIENMLFESCESLTEINLPKKLTSIGNSAFYKCKSLQSLVIPEGVKEIGSWAFYGCESLQSLVIPEGVKEIGSWAFYGCESLQSLVIPEGVEKIGYAAFKGCSSLTSISLPASLKDLDSLDPFKKCDALKEIIIPKGTRAHFEQMDAIKEYDHQSKLVEK